jgi:hypothetical protein
VEVVCVLLYKQCHKLLYQESEFHHFYLRGELIKESDIFLSAFYEGIFFDDDCAGSFNKFFHILLNINLDS